MEGTYWLRLSAIAALFLGSIYLLSPTILQEDASSRHEESASRVSTGSKVSASLDVVFEGTGGVTEASVSAVESRLSFAEVPVDRVKLDEGKLLVKMGVGARRGDVIRLVTRPGKARLIDPATLPKPPASAEDHGDRLSAGLATALGALDADLLHFAWALPEFALATLPADAVALDVQIASAVSDPPGVRVTLGGDLPKGTRFAVVAIDDVVTGVVVPAKEDFSYMSVGKPGEEGFDYDTEAPALLVSGPLGQELVVRANENTDAVTRAENQQQAEVRQSSLPPWLRGMLPDTRMNLGLDLQGGIDMTLDVDLEEACLGQAQRDAVYIKERAARDGLTFENVHRAPEEPVILVQTDDSLDKVTEFFRENARDYAYGYSRGNVHGYEMKDERQKEVGNNAVEQVLETLRRRLDVGGVKEPSIVKKGGGKINVQLPGEVDLQSAVDAIGTTAVLEFRLVDEGFDESILDKHLLAASKELPEEQYNDDDIVNRWLWQTKRLTDGQMVLWTYDERADGSKERQAPVALQSEVKLTGNDVNNAAVSFGQQNEPYVRLEFKPRGGQVFCDLSSDNINKRFAIILDNEVISTPVIRDRICGGVASIEMGLAEDPVKEANTLALVLRTGSLDAPVNIGDLRTVGSLLGADAIRSGSIASVVGALIVLVFMAVWYGKAGLIADAALILNIMLAFSILALFGATLTLPGIAGIALTAGMAVDANIIIYERIREELAHGVPARKAVDIGFEKAVVAVLDANVTTAIAGIVLFSYGTGPIKGFAVTLLIGIITTLVTALFVTRTFMDLLTRSSTAVLRL